MNNKSKLEIWAIVAIIAGMLLLSTACGGGSGDSDNGNGNEDDPPLSIEMVLVPAGSFTMGSADGTDAHFIEQPSHTVTFSYSFYIGKYPVTQAQYKTVMGNNPSHFQGAYLLRRQGNGNNLPVETVTWFDAVEFCNRLSIEEGLTPVYEITVISTDGKNITDASVSANWSNNGYRLPTEAEWEYAAKGGDGSPGNYTYSGSNDPVAVAWYIPNRLYAGTHIVRTRAPNGLGIYDMSGNVWEWCWDLYGYYPSKSNENPVINEPSLVGEPSLSYRVFRGGCWAVHVNGVRSANRSLAAPVYRSDAMGFRLVRCP